MVFGFLIINNEPGNPKILCVPFVFSGLFPTPSVRDSRDKGNETGFNCY